MRTIVVVGLLVFAGCGGVQSLSAPAPAPQSAPASASAAMISSAPAVAPSAPAPAASASAAPVPPQLHYTAHPVALPGAAGPVSLDYLGCDRAAGRFWIPAGGTGSVDVIDAATGQVSRIEGFPTTEREFRGKKHVVGPSSVTFGEHMVYVGNRATSEVCAVDPSTMKRGACVKLASSPDGIQYIAATKEVWVTTPRSQAISILDAAKPAALRVKGSIALPGDPEGYAVDSERGRFFTNLEDKDKTLVIDVKSHAIVATWEPQCGSEGPRGLALDASGQWLVVACTDHVQVLDAAHEGALRGRLDTGGGVDNLDYLPTSGRLYIASGATAQLTVAQLGDGGSLVSLGVVPTARGARNAVVNGDGTVCVANSQEGQVLLLKPGP